MLKHRDVQDHLWSARVLKDDPEAVQATHLAYCEAGDSHIKGSSLQDVGSCRHP